MEHRHLSHSDYLPAAIDDIIGRGSMRDWLNLRDACQRDPAVARKVAAICRAHIHDASEHRYHFWAGVIGAH